MQVETMGTVKRLCAAGGLTLMLSACVSERFNGPSLQVPPRQSQVLAEREPEPDFGPGSRSGPIDSAPLEAPRDSQQGQPGAMAALPSEPAPRPSRSSATGVWRAQEASGAACRVTLSSAPALDLYKANASGCANKDLAAINAWEFRDSEVFLYARGGVVARLRDQGGSFSGLLAKSGAPLTLTK